MYRGVQAAADKLLEEQQRKLAEITERPSMLRAGRSRAVLRQPVVAPVVVVAEKKKKKAEPKGSDDEEEEENDGEEEEEDTPVPVMVVKPPPTKAFNFVLPLMNVVSFKTPTAEGEDSSSALAASPVEVEGEEEVAVGGMFHTEGLHATIHFTSHNCTIGQLKSGDTKFAVSHAIQQYLHLPASHVRLATPLLQSSTSTVGEDEEAVVASGSKLQNYLTTLAPTKALDLAHLMVTDIIDVQVVGTTDSSLSRGAVTPQRTKQGKPGARVKVTLQLSQVATFTNHAETAASTAPASSCFGVSYGTVVAFPYADAVRVKLSDGCGGNTILVRCRDDEPLRNEEVVMLTVEPGCIRAQCQTPHRALGHWTLQSHEQAAAAAIASRADKRKKKKAEEEQDELVKAESDVDSDASSSSGNASPTTRSKRDRDVEESAAVVADADDEAAATTETPKVVDWKLLQRKNGTKKNPSTALVDTLAFTWFSKEEKDELYEKWREKKRLRDLGPEGAAKELAAKKKKDAKAQEQKDKPAAQAQNLTMAGMSDSDSDDDSVAGNLKSKKAAGGQSVPDQSRKVRFGDSSDDSSSDDEVDRARNAPSGRVAAAVAADSSDSD